MPEPPIPFPSKEPQEPQQKPTSFLPIVIILGVFFLLVFLVAVLLLPDKGKKLLKLTDTNAAPAQHLTVAPMRLAPAPSVHC